MSVSDADWMGQGCEDEDDNTKDCPEGNIPHYPTGLCPCCGVELEVHIPYYFPRGVFQRCTSCGWEGDILYDL